MNLFFRNKEVEAVIQDVSNECNAYGPHNLKEIVNKLIYNHPRLVSPNLLTYRYDEGIVSLARHLDIQETMELFPPIRIRLQLLGKLGAFNKRGGYLWR